MANIIVTKTVDGFNALVALKPYSLVSVELPNINVAMKELGVKDGVILIDRLLSMGNVEDRFIEATVENGAVVPSSLKPVAIKKKSVARQQATALLKKHEEVLEYSLLTEVQKRIIRRGLTL